MTKKIFNLSLLSIICLPAVIFLPITKDNFIIKEVVFTANAVIAFVLFALCAPTERFRELIRKEKFTLAVFALFITSILLSGLNARHPALMLEVFTLQLLFLALFILPAVLDDKNINDLFTAAAGVFICICLYGITQRFGADPLSWKSSFGGRPGSTFGNPNFFAGYLVVNLPLFLGLLFSGKKHRVLFAAAFVVGVFNLYLSWTRGAWIAFAVSMVFFTFFTAYTRKRLAAWFVAFFIFSAVFGFFAKGKAYQYFNPSNQSVIERVFKWRTALKMIKEHPYLGIGAGNMKVNFALYQQKVRDKAGFRLRGTSESNVHNEFLQIFAEQGLLGLLSFLAIFGYLLYRFLRSEKTPVVTGLVSGITAFLILSLSNFPLRIAPTALLVFIFYGLIIRLISGFNKEEKFYIITNRGKRFLIVVILAVCSLFVLKHWVFNRFGAEVLRFEGDKANTGRDFLKAISLYKRAIELDYYHSERTSYDLGEVYRALGRIDDALDSYRVSVDLRNYGEVYHNIGNCYYLKKDFGSALKNWRIAYDMGLPEEKDQENLKKNIRVLEASAQSDF